MPLLNKRRLSIALSDAAARAALALSGFITNRRGNEGALAGRKHARGVKGNAPGGARDARGTITGFSGKLNCLNLESFNVNDVTIHAMPIHRSCDAVSATNLQTSTNDLIAKLLRTLFTIVQMVLQDPHQAPTGSLFQAIRIKH